MVDDICQKRVTLSYHVPPKLKLKIQIFIPGMHLLSGFSTMLGGNGKVTFVRMYASVLTIWCITDLMT